MDTASFFTSFFALIFVIGLIWLFSIFLRKYGATRLPGLIKGKNQRVSIEDALVIDARRKIILVRCDDTEHLILIGPEHDLLIKSEKKPKKNAPKDAKE